MDELKEYAPSEVVICLAGNKMDIPGAHAVNMQEGQNFARKHQIQVCKEVSAKTNEGVDALFHAVATVPNTLYVIEEIQGTVRNAGFAQKI